ncbi:hypothetical protein GCM10010123_41200 [Pilimelia anulata]|uniref:Uncharacterized protein n=1 Tax=Pilimelia anulata TaxID=53371 RepID=A0A8J3BJ12_9ACTN|nr:hypothetical protein [Pilimelia anulata]GGK07138.1 hypothetical protein GCM10010123_41200 [Pilimelia anulata]
MEADWIPALAAAGAAAIVEVVLTETWRTVRPRLARALGCGDADRERRAAARLDATAAELARGGSAERARVAREVRLADLLADDPGAAGPLRDLLAGLRPAAPGPVQRITATGAGTAYGVMYGTQEIHHHPPPA